MKILIFLPWLAGLLAIIGIVLHRRRRPRVVPAVRSVTTPVEASLPEWLRPTHPPGTMIRAGRDADGGYVLPEASFAECDGLVSLGVNDDWSFESAFVAARRRPVDAYDPTVGARDFLRHAVSQTFASLSFRIKRRRKNLERPAHAWKVLFNYLHFFRGSVRHHRLWVSGETGPGRVTLAEALHAGEIGRCSRLMVKLDIEGAEYTALAALPLGELRRVAALLVEFHDVDSRLNEIKAITHTLAAADFAVRHVHPNNCSPVRAGTPTTIEVTWTRRSPSDPTGPEPGLPLPGLDQANTDCAPDIHLRFGG